MITHTLLVLQGIPDKHVLDALPDSWAWRIATTYLNAPWSVQDFRAALRVRLTQEGCEVSVAGLNIDPLTLGAMSDSLAAFAEVFMAGFCYRENATGAEHETKRQRINPTKKSQP